MIGILHELISYVNNPGHYGSMLDMLYIHIFCMAGRIYVIKKS